jgi:hypothetical protein
MTIAEEIFRLDTEIQKLSKALCATGLIVQHLKHSHAYIPDRHAFCLSECESVLRWTESQMHEELGKRLSDVLGCQVIDDEVIAAFLPQYKDPDEQVMGE